MRACVKVRWIIRNSAALMLAVCMLISCVVSSFAIATPVFATDADRSYATWTEVSKAIDNQLQQGQNEYRSGNNSGAATRFQAAYNSVYVASNMITVVRDTIGQDKVQAQQDQFQQLQTLVYQQNQGSQISAVSKALSEDVAQTAAQLDSNAKLDKPNIYAQKLRAQIKAERKKLDAAKKKNLGRNGRTWSQVAREMNVILDKSVATYKSAKGNQSQVATAVDLINEAYYQYYEKLGFEKNVMNAISGSRVSTVEYQFKECRQAMNNGKTVEQAKKFVTDLKAMLIEDAAKLDGGASSSANPLMQFITSSFGQAFVILLREGLEALLVVAAIIAYLIKSGHKNMVKYIYLGLVAGIVASLIVAALFGLLFNGSGPQQEITEGVVALFAMLMLLYTSNWMISRSSVQAWNKYISDQTTAAVSQGSLISLVLLSFLAVFREGAETVIFYQAIFAVSNGADSMIWGGFVAAAAVLVVIFLLIRFASVRIPIRPFFTGTSALMSVLVVIFAGGGVHALIEGDALAGMYIQGLPTNDWLGFYPYVETIVAQIVAVIVVISLLCVSIVRSRGKCTVENK
ncbi:FTR1 family iron permease [Gardnerella vaginalis]|uniref:Iron permease FTR1 family protein n=1 Tax=Gardnerella vaginalis TaxID=2702 RepID=A0A133NUW3_GARVA|nr:FTR1 family protein [Gardnerella vaginalis]EPI43083.1 iron permease FTR1 family protein [Gardnerella vaginalis JCP8481A]EPI43564.1 iron permease FTR1 family protein [Gardnerella vaginalis JCP8481B]KXA20055.1 iron permease FTR1 family protein [Gardnerella vaginalis]